jgi:hypothetical protein
MITKNDIQIWIVCGAVVLSLFSIEIWRALS